MKGRKLKIKRKIRGFQLDERKKVKRKGKRKFRGFPVWRERQTNFGMGEGISFGNEVKEEKKGKSGIKEGFFICILF